MILRCSPRFTVRKSVILHTLMGAVLIWGSPSGWGTTTLPLAVCSAPAHQDLPMAAADGSGGSIVAWTDHRNERDADIYAQWIDATGEVRWASDGIAVCAAVGSQHLTGVVADGSGGAVFVWVDHRSANESDEDIYAQRLGPDGSPLWGANGVAVGRGPGTQAEAVLVSDGADGAIIVWTDNANGSGAGVIRGQRIGAAGDLLWDPNGLEIAASSAGGGQRAPAVVADGAGGAVIAWVDGRSRAGQGEIYAQRIGGDGERIWSVSDTAVTTSSSTALAGGPMLVADGAGGVLVAWSASEDENGTPQVRGQRISSSGTPLWAEEGVIVAPGESVQSLSSAATGGAGDFYLAWTEEPTTGSRRGWAQRLDGAGVALWAAQGVPFSPADARDVAGLTALADGDGGVMLVWQERSSAETTASQSADIYAARLGAAGNMEWGGAPVAVSATPVDAFSPTAVKDGNGELTVFWYNHESEDHNIYGRKITGVQ